MKPYTQIGSLVSPDDFFIGSHVTVHSLAHPSHARLADGAPRTASLSPSVAGGAPPAGMPLQIRAVSLPFLVCGVLQLDGTHLGPVILDVRRVRLIRVSRQFVRAIMAFNHPESQGEERADSLSQTAYTNDNRARPSAGHPRMDESDETH